MTMLSVVQYLKTLIEIDQSIAQCESELAGANQLIEKDHLVIEKLKQQLVLAKKACIAARKHLDEQEIEAEDLQMQENEKRAVLDHVHNQKEFNSIQKEIDLIVRKRNAQEDDLLKAWHAAEAADKKLVDDTKQIEEKIALMQQEIETKTQAQSSAHEQLKTFNDNRHTAAQKITPEWLTKYDRMRKSVANPIIPLADSSCSCCYYTVPPQDLARIKKSEIVPCKGCYRLLYCPNAERRSAQRTQS